MEFNQLLIWRDQLTTEYNVQIERVSISQTDKPAIIEADFFEKIISTLEIEHSSELELA